MILTRVCWLTNPDDVVSGQLDVCFESARDYWKHRDWNTQLPDVEQVRSPITSNVVGLFCFQPFVDFKGLTETDFKFWHTFFDTPLTHHSSTKWTMWLGFSEHSIRPVGRITFVEPSPSVSVSTGERIDNHFVIEIRNPSLGFVWMMFVVGLHKWIEELSSIGWDTLFSSHYDVRVVLMLDLSWVVSHTSPNVSGSLWGLVVYLSITGTHVDNVFFLPTLDILKSIVS